MNLLFFLYLAELIVKTTVVDFNPTPKANREVRNRGASSIPLKQFLLRPFVEEKLSKLQGKQNDVIYVDISESRYLHFLLIMNLKTF